MAINQVILNLSTIYFPTSSGLEIRAGAAEVIKRLNSVGPYVFATNSASKDTGELYIELAKAGLHIDFDRIVDPVTISLDYVKNHQ